MTLPVKNPLLNSILKGHTPVPQGLSIRGAATPKRVMRSPRHTFQLRHKPFVAQPFMIAPVLPGETLKKAMLQSRAISSPVKNQVVGWHLEHYLYYVPLRCLNDVDYPITSGNNGPAAADGRTAIESMLMDIQSPFDALAGTASPSTYSTAKAPVDWARFCLAAVLMHDFRHEGEALDAPFSLLDGLPMVKLSNRDIADSLFDSTALSLDDAFTSPVTGTSGTPPDDVTGEAATDLGDLQGAYDTWAQLTAMKLIQLTFEDYLASFGVQTPKTILGASIELIRYSRQWQYPSNTVEPTTGVPSSALSWVIDVTADRDRFFKEPGFIFGVTCSRPKTYRKNQEFAAANLMIDALSWMPASMKDVPGISLRTYKEDAGEGFGPYAAASVAGSSDGSYTLDLRDLFVYGDQFLNFALSEANASLVTSPAFNDTNIDNGEVNAASEYAADADVDALFSGSTDATRVITQDGVCQLHVLGTQVDHT